MKKFAPILAMALFAGSAAAQAPQGEWTGSGFQDGETWDMQAFFVPGAARIEYPDFPCGGVWVFRTDQAPFTGTEWLTYGQDACWDGLTVVVTPQDDGLQVTWREKNAAVVATGVLKKVVTAKGTGKK